MLQLAIFAMHLDDVYRYFQNPPATYLNQELAVCYVLSVLLRGDSYGTELIQLLEREYPTYRLSDTVLYSALKFLEDEGLVTGYWKKVEGRGRPRRMLQIFPRNEASLRSWLSFGEGMCKHILIQLQLSNSVCTLNIRLICLKATVLFRAVTKF